METNIRRKKNTRKIVGRTALIWLGVAAFCGLFALIYQNNSHDITSAYMTFAFVPALVLGFGVYGVMFLARVRAPRLGGTIYQSGIITVTVGMIAVGVFRIYGTDNQLLPIYFFAGGGLMTVGVIVMIVERKRISK